MGDGALIWRISVYVDVLGLDGVKPQRYGECIVSHDPTLARESPPAARTNVSGISAHLWSVGRWSAGALDTHRPPGGSTGLCVCAKNSGSYAAGPVDCVWSVRCFRRPELVRVTTFFDLNRLQRRNVTRS
jgi:hypothetical protein